MLILHSRLSHALLISSLFFLTSCGYQFRGSGSTLPEDVQTVGVDMVQNDTTIPRIGLLMTEELRSQFERYGVVNVSDTVAGADAVLKAKIVSVDSRVKDVTGSSDIELETEVTMTVSAELLRDTGQLLWKDDNVKIRKTIASTSDVVVTSSSSFAQGGITSSTLGSLGSKEVERGLERDALEDMIEQAAQTVYIRAIASDF